MKLLGLVFIIYCIYQMCTVKKKETLSRYMQELEKVSEIRKRIQEAENE